ncbi:MAG: DUF547 domain-containing protein [Chthoniobacterales bacterium]|nr:DUF547 domain-containing protein [Chthoniobacterales bacterium]
MKLLRVLLVLVSLCCIGTAAGQGADDWQKTYDQLLERYAASSGVKYAAWKGNAEDLKRLDQVVNAIGAANISGLNRNEQLAFYINAYNAWMLHEALEKYPTKSVKDLLFTFFTSNRIKVAGQQMSFNKLEKEVIIPKFQEPGVHFALNCASRSCPPLDRRLFRGSTVQSRMEQLARDYINSPQGVKYDESSKTAQLSQIFEWYESDFRKEGGPVAYINKRRREPLPEGTKITYQKYDWSLNEAK